MLTAQLANTSFADDVIESISRGDVDGLSMSFMADDDDWQQTDDGIIRTLRSVSLGSEISLVLTPAYPQARVSLRSVPADILALLDVTLEQDDIRRYTALQFAARRLRA